MDFSVVGNIISSIGFPIFVAVWLLWKSSNDTREMERAINALENAILEISSYIKAIYGVKKEK